MLIGFEWATVRLDAKRPLTIMTQAMSLYRIQSSLTILAKPIKYLILLLLLINIRSAPFAWHCK